MDTRLLCAYGEIKMPCPDAYEMSAFLTREMLTDKVLRKVWLKRKFGSA